MARYINEEDVKKLLCLDSCQPGSRCPDAGFCKEIEDAVAAMPGVDLSVERPARDAARWIPVSERLPELIERFSDCDGFKKCEDGGLIPIDPYTAFESDPVLALGFSKGERIIFVACYSEWRFADGTKETDWCDNLEGDYRVNNVAAWMPLPEPYKEAENA